MTITTRMSCIAAGPIPTLQELEAEEEQENNAGFMSGDDKETNAGTLTSPQQLSCADSFGTLF